MRTSSAGGLPALLVALPPRPPLWRLERSLAAVLADLRSLGALRGVGLAALDCGLPLGHVGSSRVDGLNELAPVSAAGLGPLHRCSGPHRSRWGPAGVAPTPPTPPITGSRTFRVFVPLEGVEPLTRPLAGRVHIALPGPAWVPLSVWWRRGVPNRIMPAVQPASPFPYGGGGGVCPAASCLLRYRRERGGGVFSRIAPGVPSRSATWRTPRSPCGLSSLALGGGLSPLNPPPVFPSGSDVRGFTSHHDVGPSALPPAGRVSGGAAPRLPGGCPPCLSSDWR